PRIEKTSQGKAAALPYRITPACRSGGAGPHSALCTPNSAILWWPSAKTRNYQTNPIFLEQTRFGINYGKITCVIL
ncbi:MAG TPA: hypothetical protein VL527_15775, partial [Dongiaceae bacterium]|nr:hypothetical protein [Dongiaceae bacterium]